MLAQSFFGAKAQGLPMDLLALALAPRDPRESPESVTDILWRTMYRWLRKVSRKSTAKIHSQVYQRLWTSAVLQIKLLQPR